jgi:hypothetical protein
MKPLDEYPLDELKLVYRILHSAITEYHELMDGELLQQLQTHLQVVARGEGIDVSLHAQWAAWLEGH